MNLVSKNINKVLFAAISFVVVFFSMSVTANCKNDTLETRLAPVGMVCVEGEECKEPVAEVAEADTAKEARSGSELVADYCGGCHQSGVAGAPTIGGTFKDLGARGVEDLVASAMKGKNAMPRKGGCSDCTKEELEGAIKEMLK